VVSLQGNVIGECATRREYRGPLVGAKKSGPASVPAACHRLTPHLTKKTVVNSIMSQLFSLASLLLIRGTKNTVSVSTIGRVVRGRTSNPDVDLRVLAEPCPRNDVRQEHDIFLD
jgi:hypothetical protein